MISAGKVEEMEIGSGKCVETEEGRIAVFRVRKNDFKAITGLCPHQGAPLEMGHVEDGKVICPWHAWEFDLDTGACTDVPQDRLRTFNVVVENEEVFIKL